MIKYFFRTSLTMGPTIFLLSGITVDLISVKTLSFQAQKTARINIKETSADVYAVRDKQITPFE